MLVHQLGGAFKVFFPAVILYFSNIGFSLVRVASHIDAKMKTIAF